MAADNPRRPRPEDPDPGFEVVSDPAPRPARPVTAKPLPPAPPARPLPPARPAPKRVAEDPGFEVVSAAPPPKKPKVRVVDDDDTEEAPRSKARTRTDHRTDDDEDAPRRRSRRDEDDDRDDDRPRKKKKKHRKGGIEISDGANNVMLEWGGPVFLMILGLALGIAGTVGEAMKPNSGIPVVLSTVFFVIGQLIWIPIEIVGLMVIGKLFGIEYGDITSAVRNLAAMGFLVSGLINALGWAGLPWFLASTIVFVVGLGLFITLFKLDVWEAIVTMFGLNVLSMAFNVLMFVVVIAMFIASARSGGGDFDDDLDSGPSIQQRGEFDPGDFDDDFDGDDQFRPPPPRNGAKGPAPKGGARSQPRSRPPFPDDE